MQREICSKVHAEGDSVWINSPPNITGLGEGVKEGKKIVLVQSQDQIQKTKENHMQQWNQAGCKRHHPLQRQGSSVCCLLQTRNSLVCHNFNINSHLKGDQIVTDHLLKTITSEDVDFSLKDDALLRKQLWQFTEILISSKCYYFLPDQTIRWCIQAIEKRDRFSNILMISVYWAIRFHFYIRINWKNK